MTASNLTALPNLPSDTSRREVSHLHLVVYFSLGPVVSEIALDQNSIRFRVSICDGSSIIFTLTWIQYYGPLEKNLCVDTISNGG